MNRLNRTVLLSLCLGAAAHANYAQAADFRFQLGTTLSGITVGTTDTAAMGVFPNRSYCVEIATINATGNQATFGSTVTDNLANMEVSVTSRGSAYPSFYGDNLFMGSSNSKLCFITSGTSDSSLAEVQFNIDTSAGASSSNNTLRATETTLTGGFNTSVTDFNFLELTNTGSSNNADTSQVSGLIRIRNAITNQDIVNTPFFVDAGDRFDFNIHGATGADAFGIVTVIHNGVPGQLKAVVSQYRIVTPSPLDFEPVLQQPLLTPAGTP